MKRLFTYPFISRMLGLVLLLAGILKAYDAPIDLAGPSEGTWDNQGMRAGELAGEILFGSWLLVGMFPRATWWMAIGSFVGLLGIAFDKALAGETSCGCFGRFPIHPWYTFAFDALAILGLTVAQPTKTTETNVGRSHWRWAALAGLIMATFGGLQAAWQLTDSRINDEGDINHLDGEVQLQPSQWLGSRFPLAKYIDIGPQLMRGRWALMFYHTDCSICRLSIPQYMGLAYQLASQTSTVRIALIEVPPFDHGSASLAGRRGACTRGRLTDAHRWRIKTPTYILLDDGMVTRSMRELDSLCWELEAGGNAAAETEGFLFPDYGMIRRKMFLSEIACGPLALLELLKDFGVPLNEEEVDRLLAEAGNKGIDMLRLKKLAEEYGLHALGVGVSTKALRQLGQKAIVHLNGAGFVAVTGYTAEGLIVVYPLQPPGIVPDDLFEKSFGKEGRAILIGKIPLHPEALGVDIVESQNVAIEGPHLSVSQSVITVGRIHRKNWVESLIIMNDGNSPLEIREVSTDCGCFQASVDKKILQPGEQALLRAKGVQNELGGFTHHVRIKTNTPEITVVPVRGYSEAPVSFSQPAVFLKGIRQYEKAETIVALALPLKLDASKLRMEAAKEGPFRAQLNRDERGCYLNLRWEGAAKKGFYHYEIRVFSENVPDAVAAVLPCTVEVIPELIVQPPSLLIEKIGDNKTWRRRLVIEANRQPLEEPTLNWSNSPGAAWIKTSITREDKRKIIVEMIGLFPQKGSIDSNALQLTVKVGEGRAVSIPIRFLKVGRE